MGWAVEKPGTTVEEIRGMTFAGRLVAFFLAAALGPLFLAGLVALFSASAGLGEGNDRLLLSQAEHRAGEILHYVDDKKDLLLLVSQSPFLGEALERFSVAFGRYGPESAEYGELDGSLRPYLENVRDNGGFYDFFLVSAAGDIVFSVAREADFGTNLDSGPYRDSSLALACREARTMMSTELSDFRFYPPSDAYAAFFAVPVLRNGRLLGTVAGQLSTDELFSLIDYNNLGHTGEVVLARKEGDALLVLNPLRHDKNAAFSRKIPLQDSTDLPIFKAVHGETGVSGRQIDYRAKEVAAAWTYLPGLDWGLVVKIDLDEAYLTVRQLRIRFLLLGLATAAVVVLMAVFLARSFAGPVNALTATVLDLGRGEYGRRVVLKVGGELGLLTSGINRMASSLQENAERNARREWLRTGQAELDRRLRADLGMGELGGQVLSFLAERLGARVGALYVMDRYGTLELAACFGCEKEYPPPPRFGPGEGLVGQVGRTGRSLVLPAPTGDLVRISSGLGAGAPALLVVEPLAYKDTVHGVVVLGFFGNFEDAGQELLAQAAESIAIAIGLASSRGRPQRDLAAGREKEQ